ncbi:hypothetical protein [Ornithinimicrobium murale]|uniref:hypothetical protein n=1 Tax=Ornithinimicrobium murale TaxID=1050153 RepID=UPI001EE06661|nr:hypothetical protein [Ornithinimicrobium murale]
MAPATSPATLVLLEGPSDVAAVSAVLAARGGRGEHSAYELVDLGGVTNVGAQLRRAVDARPAPRVVGLCDAGEARVVLRALQRIGRTLTQPQELPGEHFFVCDRDLEDELIRALGPDRCLEVLAEQGLAGRFAAFSRQQAWEGRPLLDRLHRFCGIASGRKVLLAGAMAGALAPGEAPAPIEQLVDCLTVADADA